MKTLTYYLLTLGCPKNDVVAENAASTLLSCGLTGTDTPRLADIVFINGCSFITPAVEEVKREIEAIVAGKAIHQKIIIFGCLAQRFASPAALNLSGIDGFYPTLAEVVSAIGLHPNNTAPRLPIFKTYGYVEIARGCSKRCSYCTIPLFKGPYRSKPAVDVIREVEELTDAGIGEIVLVAQETTFYGSDAPSCETLATLIRRIAQNRPHVRLRILYAHPLGITDELVAVMKEVPAVCHYIDIPLQHSSDRLLQSMNRPPLAVAENALGKLRSEIPDICLRSTFIVGYPGETDEDIIYLKGFLQKWQFDKVGFFSYSPEPETPSAALRDRIPEAIKQKRLKELYSFQNRIARKKNRLCIGQSLEVIVEDRNGSFCAGRSYREAPEIDGQIVFRSTAAIGSKVTVRITAADSSTLNGIQIV